MKTVMENDTRQSGEVIDPVECEMKYLSDSMDHGSKTSIDESSTTLQDQDVIQRDHLKEGTNISTLSTDHSEQDSCYSWFMVVCSMCGFIMYGANWVMFSVYIVDFTEVFDKPQAYVSIIGSVDTAMSQFTALPAGAFVSLYGCRPVCLIGLLIYATGTLISAFTTNFYMLLFTFGFLKGIGAGMLYIPCSVIVQLYFNRWRPLAVAFASSGLSIGAMAFAPIHRLLIQNYGWRGGLIFFSGIVMQCTVFAALMRPPRQYPNSRSRTAENLTDEKSRSYCKSFTDSILTVTRHLHKALNVAFLKNTKLLLFLSIKTLTVVGTVSLYKFGIARAVYLGVDKFSASFLATAIGLGSSVFRYIGGFIGNLQCVNRLMLYSAGTVTGGCLIILSILGNNNFYSHLLFHLAYGAFLGISECLQPVIASDLFGIDKLPCTLGWLMAFTGIVIFAYMPIFGFFYDLTESYTISYLMSGTLQIIGGCMGFIIIFLKRKDRHLKDNNQPVNSEEVI